MAPRNFINFVAGEEADLPQTLCRRLAETFEVSQLEIAEHSSTFFCRDIAKPISVHIEIGPIEGQGEWLVIVLPAGFSIFGKKKRWIEVERVADAVEKALRDDARVTGVKRYTSVEFDDAQALSGERAVGERKRPID